jgi:hypothetical protein
VSDARDGVARARAWRDALACLDWELRGTMVAGSGPAARHDLRRLDVAACAVDLEALIDMAPLAARMTGACYAFQPLRLALGRRNRDRIRDFGAHPEHLLAGHPDLTGSAPK